MTALTNLDVTKNSACSSFQLYLYISTMYVNTNRWLVRLIRFEL